MVKVGDTVRYLNAVGGGIVTKVVKDTAYVEEDGFETPVLSRECVVVATAQPEVKAAPSKYVPIEQPVQEAPKDTIKIEETADGDRLNITLAYVPIELKHLNTTTFETYLVNDSNYYLYYTYMCRTNSGEWEVRHSGIVEPNIQIFIEEIEHDDFGDLERIAIQYLPFKQDKPFKLKNPATVEYRLDTTKFYKMHAFHANMYFDEPVIAIDFVKNDIPMRPLVVDSGELEQAMKQKKAVDSRTPVVKHNIPKAGNKDVLEVDLHIDELLDSTAGLSNSDMLNVQLDKVREVMKANAHNKGKKIVFIHGKGEGVLRNAVIKELKAKYKQCTMQDASFREYGFGATMVTVH